MANTTDVLMALRTQSRSPPDPRPGTLSSTSLPSSVECEKRQAKEQYTTPDSSPAQWRRGPGFWRCFIAVCVPILLSAFEGSVVSTALPTISAALGLGSNSSWVATAFLLASIVFQPLYGQLADIWGRRHLMMVAVVIFGVGSAISGWADDGTVLILGRVVQGMGSGGIDLFAELILCDIIPLQRRGHYVAIKAAVYALGTTVGPLLGGVFAQSGKSNWRWCFGVNIPICLMALIMMWFWLQVSNGSGWEDCSLKKKLGQVDYFGISLLTTSVVLILFALTTGGCGNAWNSPIIIWTLTCAVLELVAFVLWERCRWCSHPIMAPHVFSNRTTVAAFCITIFHGFITYGFQFYLPPFFQAVLGSSPAKSGELILPCTLTIVILAAVGGPLLAKFGRYRLMHRAGFLLMAAGLLPCILIHDSSLIPLWIMLSLLVGLGSGIIVSTTLPTVLVELTDKENAAATGSWAFLRGLGSLLGVAIPNAAFNAEFEIGLKVINNAHLTSKFGSGLAYEHASATFISKLDADMQPRIIALFASAFKVVWVIFFVFALIGLATTFLERQVALRRELDSEFGLVDKKKVESVIV
ncbi:major facilitator superfamily domain-containing protein [Cladorrhinum samala]|uniref:Major facilitator superfamily domain-containing protein n=1 Tax=Cladorrhinum samala TaxID=585594 RepID=A0AAV9HYK6_9PEZI|nr:major facilitator superfamily domain-containing protein [Cladorrhinum samala]